MKIVVASDSFKGSLSSREVGEIFKRVAAEISPDIEVVTVEIADGGEGTLDAVVASGKFTTREASCHDPFFRQIKAPYGISGEVALVEMAKASGLTLIPYRDGNALITTSFGTGELIADAVKSGAKEVIVTVGGSATNDGGVGALDALGYEFLDMYGRELVPMSALLAEIASIDDSDILDTSGVKFTVLTDVDNPFVGPNGATYVYGEQKGAVGEHADRLEAAMCNFAEVVKLYNGVDLKNMPGAGAAGGLAGGLHALLGAEIKSGIESILDLVGFEEKLEGADAVITGEGRIDDQSTHGKAISGVSARAKKHSVPVYAMVGCSEISEEGVKELGLSGVYPISKHASGVDDSIANAATYAEQTAREIVAKLSSAS